MAQVWGPDDAGGPCCPAKGLHNDAEKIWGEVSVLLQIAESEAGDTVPERRITVNYFNANMEACKALSRGELVRGHDVDENTIFFTTNGFYGYIIPKDRITFDASRIKQLPNKIIEKEAYCKPENEIRMTNHLFAPSERKLVRRFDGKTKGKEWNVFIDVSFLKKLESDSYCFMQSIDTKKNMSLQVVMAARKTIENGEPLYIPTMIFLPCRILDNES